MLIHKRKQSVVVYLEVNTATKGGKFMIEHFSQFKGKNDLQIQNLTKEHLQEFSDYLTAKLNGNTVNAYFSKLRTVLKRAIADNETLDVHFIRLGSQFYELYKVLQSLESIKFSLSV